MGCVSLRFLRIVPPSCLLCASVHRGDDADNQQRNKLAAQQHQQGTVAGKKVSKRGLSLPGADVTLLMVYTTVILYACLQ